MARMWNGYFGTRVQWQTLAQRGASAHGTRGTRFATLSISEHVLNRLNTYGWRDPTKKRPDDNYTPSPGLDRSGLGEAPSPKSPVTVEVDGVTCPLAQA
jgi:hypothetical protein